MAQQFILAIIAAALPMLQQRIPISICESGDAAAASIGSAAAMMASMNCCAMMTSPRQAVQVEPRSMPLSDHDRPRFERRTNAGWSFEPYESGIGLCATRGSIPSATENSQ